VGVKEPLQYRPLAAALREAGYELVNIKELKEKTVVSVVKTNVEAPPPIAAPGWAAGIEAVRASTSQTPKNQCGKRNQPLLRGKLL
jgi:hypothetical protein